MTHYLLDTNQAGGKQDPHFRQPRRKTRQKGRVPNFLRDWARFALVFPWISEPVRSVTSPFIEANLFPPRRPIGPSTILHLLRVHRRLPDHLNDLKLPPAPKSWSVAELRLPRKIARQIDQLTRSNAQDLEPLTLGDAARCLGIRGLIGYLKSLEAVRTSLPPAFERPVVFDSLRFRIEKLLSAPGFLELSPNDPRLQRLILGLIGERGSWPRMVARAVGASLIGINDRQAARLSTICTNAEEFTLRTLDDEFLDISAGNDEQRRDLVVRHYGIGGGKRQTLAQIGQARSVSRERIRQLMIIPVGARHNDPNLRPFCPIADRITNSIDNWAPCLAQSAEKRLRAMGMLGPGTQLENAIRMIRRLNRKVKPSVHVYRSVRVLANPRQLNRLREVVNAAYRQVTMYGACHLPALLAHFDLPTGAVASEMIVRRRGFEWLGKQTGWCRFETESSYLRNRLRKIFSVTPRLTPVELRRALQREYRYGSGLPPLDVLKKILRRVPTLHVQGGWVYPNSRSRPEDVLDGTEFSIVQLLLSKGGISRGDELKRDARTRGISASSFWQCVHACPAIQQYVTGIYGLVGADISPGQVESLQTRRRPRSIL